MEKQANNGGKAVLQSKVPNTLHQPIPKINEFCINYYLHQIKIKQLENEFVSKIQQIGQLKKENERLNHLNSQQEQLLDQQKKLIDQLLLANCGTSVDKPVQDVSADVPNKRTRSGGIPTKRLKKYLQLSNTPTAIT